MHIDQDPQYVIHTAQDYVNVDVMGNGCIIRVNLFDMVDLLGGIGMDSVQPRLDQGLIFSMWRNVYNTSVEYGIQWMCVGYTVWLALYTSIPFFICPFYTLFYSIYSILYYTIYYSILYYILFYIILYYTILYYIILYTLFYIILYTILYIVYSIL